MTHLEIGLVLAALLCFAVGVWAGLEVRSLRKDVEDRNRIPGISWQVPRDRTQFIVRVELANARRFQRGHLPDEAQEDAAFDRVAFWLEAMYSEEGLPPWQERWLAAAKRNDKQAPPDGTFPEEDYALRRLPAGTWREIGCIELRRTESFAKENAAPGEFSEGNFLYVSNWMRELQEQDARLETEKV